MVSTQKLTSLVFSYYDYTKLNKDLSDEQKMYLIEVRPSAIELFSYLFCFQGILVGPLVFYTDYIEFINGKSILKHTKSSYAQPSITVIFSSGLLGNLFFKRKKKQIYFSLNSLLSRLCAKKL
jgi:hypothetical protein